jgi:hypothetical protein
MTPSRKGGKARTLHFVFGIDFFRPFLFAPPDLIQGT